jgi:hypothetical protein
MAVKPGVKTGCVLLQATTPACGVCVRVGAGNEAVAVWRCLLLPDSKHKGQEEQTQQQLLQQLKQLRRSADGPRADGAAAGAAAAAAAGPGPGSAAAVAGLEADAAAGCVWAIFMLRGGHFAGAVVRVNSSSSSKGSRSRQGAQQLPAAADQASSRRAQGEASSSQASSRQGQDKGQQLPGYPPGSEPFTVLAHKTFHRYVVR